MPPMLLQRGDGKHDRYVLAQGGHIGPGEIGELHEYPLFWLNHYSGAVCGFSRENKSIAAPVATKVPIPE